MSTRMTSMTITHRAKQKLLQLLSKNEENYPFYSSSLKNNSTSSSISYSKLRTAYLKRIHEIHPDKLLTSNNTKEIHENDKNKKVYNKDYVHKRFIELQSAWNEYDKLFKLTKSNSAHSTHREDIEEDDVNNFTMFGVGCSFSDSPEERENRRKITDEACRGWFTSGLISERSNTNTYNIRSSHKNISSVSLIDNDMFIEDSTLERTTSSDNGDNKRQGGTSSSPKFLFDLPKFKSKR